MASDNGATKGGFRELYRAPGRLLTFTRPREYIKHTASTRYAVSLILIRRRMGIAGQLHSNTSTPLANKITYLTLSSPSAAHPLTLPPPSPPPPFALRSARVPLLKHLCKLVINQRYGCPGRWKVTGTTGVPREYQKERARRREKIGGGTGRCRTRVSPRNYVNRVRHRVTGGRHDRRTRFLRFESDSENEVIKTIEQRTGRSFFNGGTPDNFEVGFQGSSLGVVTRQTDTPIFLDL